MHECVLYIFWKYPHFLKTTPFSLNISCYVLIYEKLHEISDFGLIRFGPTMFWNSVQKQKTVILITYFRWEALLSKINTVIVPFLPTSFRGGTYLAIIIAEGSLDWSSKILLSFFFSSTLFICSSTLALETAASISKNVG